MDKVVAIYTQLTDIAVSLGVPTETAFLVPGLFIMLFIGLSIRSLFKGRSNPKDPRGKEKTRSSVGTSKGQANKKTKTQTSIEYRGGGGRHFDRQNLAFNAEYIIEGVEPTRKKCKIFDVSLSGLGIVCAESIEKDSKVRIYLPNYDSNFPDNEFNISGIVVRESPRDKGYEYGIRFFLLLRQKERLLNLFIEKNS